IGDSELRRFTSVLLSPGNGGDGRTDASDRVAGLSRTGGLISRARLAVSVALAKQGKMLEAVEEARLIPDVETQLAALVAILPHLAHREKVLALEVAFGAVTEWH